MHLVYWTKSIRQDVYMDWGAVRREWLAFVTGSPKRTVIIIVIALICLASVCTAVMNFLLGAAQACVCVAIVYFLIKSGLQSKKK